MEEKLTQSKIYNDRELLQLPILSLAYIGDCIFELRVREYFLTKGIIKPQQLHLNTVSVVRAPNQAIISHRIEDELTETELDFFRRGRNAKSGHQPPGATVGEYRRATGLEALLGYWYLSGRNERLNWFFNKIFSD